jgi:hypothetical protein
MKTKPSLVFLQLSSAAMGAALALGTVTLPLLSLPSAALACPGESCAQCAGNPEVGEEKLAHKAHKTGRKLKCAKCAEHKDSHQPETEPTQDQKPS